MILKLLCELVSLYKGLKDDQWDITKSFEIYLSVNINRHIRYEQNIAILIYWFII